MAQPYYDNTIIDTLYVVNYYSIQYFYQSVDQGLMVGQSELITHGAKKGWARGKCARLALPLRSMPISDIREWKKDNRFNLIDRLEYCLEIVL